MAEPILGNNVITQVGILVNDIERAAKDWADFFGVPVPPINPTDGVEKTQAEYNGEPCDARARLAFFNAGPNVQVELIEPDKNPSTWRHDLDANGEGIHHIAFVVKGMKKNVELLESKGMKLVQKGEYTGGRYAYVNARDTLKVMLELLEND